MAKALNIKGNTVSAKDDAFLYHMISGKNGVFNYGNKMDFQTVSANLIRIKDGMAQIQGRNYIIYPSETVDVAVESGTQGNKRNDIIVIEFTKTSSNETMEIKCIKGNPSTGNATDPQIVQQDTLSSGTKYQLPLYRVKLNGINVDGVDDLRYILQNIFDIVSGNVKVGKASNTDKLGNVNASEYLTKSNTGLLQFPSASNDGLMIGLTNGMGNGKIELINNYNNAGDVINLPIPQMIAIKKINIATSSIGMVELYELWPVRGRRWQNVYNAGADLKWQGWKLISGKYILWNGTATTGAVLTLELGKALFNGYEVFFSTGERVYCPLVDGNEDIWGSLITMAGNEFYLKSFHAQMTSSTRFSILLSQQKNTANGAVSNANIVKIVGV